MHQWPERFECSLIQNSSKEKHLKHFFFHRWEINNFPQWLNTVPRWNIACVTHPSPHLPSQAVNLWDMLLFFSSSLATFITPLPHWHTVEIAKMSNHVIHYLGDLLSTRAARFLLNCFCSSLPVSSSWRTAVQTRAPSARVCTRG